MKLELVPVAVTDVDPRQGLLRGPGRLPRPDHDHKVTDALRFVQLTPPGSACSIVIGTGVTEMVPGSQKNLQLVVEDVEAIRKRLIGRGVEASEIEKHPWGWFSYFSDPDGNTWAMQQIPPRE